VYKAHQRCSTVSHICSAFSATMLALTPEAVGPADADALLGAPPVATSVLLVGSIALFVMAQGFINSLLEGKRGLSAFLSDGGGFSRSAFKPRSKARSDSAQNSSLDAPIGGPDPLPWLKLPQLDFVDVAGQEANMKQNGGLDPQEEAAIIVRLEELADLMAKEVKSGNVEEASRLRSQLESLMTKYGFQYEYEESETLSET